MLKIPHSYPHLSETDKLAVLECFDKDYVGYDNLVTDEINAILKKYFSYKYMELTTSASLAILIIFKYLKIKPSDEIIISAINCWSVYNTIIMENGTPILCDVRSKRDFRPSFDTISAKITQNTKIIFITHMYGVLVEKDLIKKLKLQYPHIHIVEDFSTTYFSKNEYNLGEYSDFGVGSFGSTKPFTGGIGGILYSHLLTFDTHYDQQKGNAITFNTKISRLNQALLLSQLKTYNEYYTIKQKLLIFYCKFVVIYESYSSDLFRAITFDKPYKIIEYLKKFEIELDVRESVQPNLMKELGTENRGNALSFEAYYSLPLNIKAYEILNSKGVL